MTSLFYMRVAFPTHSRSVWYPTHSQILLCVVHLNFRKSLTEIPRNGCGTMRAAAVTWQSPISPQMFLQTVLGRASTRHLSQPPVGGDWGLPRYSRRPHRPTLNPFLGISVSDFRKFKCTTHKNFRECVGYHTLLECVGNATRCGT